jgi:di/tripeptidase
VCCANTGEEGLGDLRGMRVAIDELQDQLSAVIVLDAQYGSVVHAGVTSRRYRIGVEAAGGHSWLDFGAPSAVHVLVRLAAQLTELHVPAEPKSTFNVGVIEGGTTVNAIAQHAALLLDLRSVSSAGLEALVQQVEQLVNTARAQHPDVTISTEIVGDRPGGSIDQEHPLVQMASAAYQAVGATVTFESASTDANIPLSRGLPAVCVGMCRGEHAHRLDEYLLVDDIPAGMRAVLLLTLAAAGGV